MNETAILSAKTKSSNNFDFLRFCAATMVIFSHCYPLTGINEQEPLQMINGHSLGWLAVVIFFIISGYLICKSYVERPNPKRYLWNRFLRIFPGLFFVLVITVFIIGPLVTILPLQEYFTNFDTWKYFSNITLYMMVYQLPGVFLSNPFPDAVNGSLWSLELEFSMYFVILFLGIFGLLKRKIPVILTSLVFFVISFMLIPEYSTTVIYGIDIKLFFDLGFYFLLGSIFYLYIEYIPFDAPMAMTILAIWLLSFSTPYFTYISYFAIPYLVLFFAFTRIPHLNNFSKYGDFSYGLYIFAFPIQQCIIYGFNGQISIPALFISSLFFTLIAAAFSWHFIESKALDLKRKDPKELLKVLRSKIRYFIGCSI